MGFLQHYSELAIPFLQTKMKIFEIPVARYYILGAFLCNLQNCFYHNQVSGFFACQPLSLDEYLSLNDEIDE